MESQGGFISGNFFLDLYWKSEGGLWGAISFYFILVEEEKGDCRLGGGGEAPGVGGGPHDSGGQPQHGAVQHAVPHGRRAAEAGAVAEPVHRDARHPGRHRLRGRDRHLVVVGTGPGLGPGQHWLAGWCGPVARGTGVEPGAQRRPTLAGNEAFVRVVDT